MKYKEIKNTLTEAQLEQILKVFLPNHQWMRMARKYPDFFDDKFDAKSFTLWLLDEQEEKEEQFKDEDIYYDKLYYYDEKRDKYIIHIPSKKRPIALDGVKWRAIRESYSNWDGQPTSINEICRRFHFSRQTAIEIIRSMGLTHSSSPFTDEVLEEESEDSLIEDLLRKKEESVYIKSQRKEWRKVRSDAEKYRSKVNYAESIMQYFDDMNGGFEIPLVEMKNPTENYIYLISPTDFHWGGYSPDYTGEPYNRDIARKLLFKTTQDLISRINVSGRPDYIVLGIGGDGLHFDTQNKTTTRGTLQDTDGTPTEIVNSYLHMLVDYINFLRQLCPLKVFCVAGNHDFYTTTLIRAAVTGFFNDTEDVEVVQDLSVRQTFLYGNSLITLVHGDDGKVNDLASIIASERPKLWGKSDYRFIFTGHLHTERELPQWGDITVYRMPSLCGTDDYHHRKGYKSRRGITGYIISQRRGVITTHFSPVEP
jgi:predicted phosphodiesterase|tara:strand:+ start:2714 stop:4156 length:1443 start_codon:yes stop_codon:yes gene_type:complete